MGANSAEEWWLPLIATLPPFASAPELAELFGVSPSTVYREWQKGTLGFVQVGGQRRSGREQVREYLRAAVRGGPGGGVRGQAAPSRSGRTAVPV